ncbi:peptide chain release factor N(5)-glutamine methyltransferase [Oceanobacillus sp. Castelsardo]|uniref:peptide chain release factor N(5)-glutamine methyltransferase n=1 Tax=Oceanobacillus sp. Castelsardo TaxID=1851204 RepID=UPI0008391992|nr:peptide chain release factor N(5)-glutamine methyltransferase [Oceanobacillus sp. Castelsardo]
MSEKLYEVQNWASLFLEKHNREPRVAEILIQHHLNISRSQYFMMMQDEIPEEKVKKIKKDIQRHAETGIPVQHIIGYEWFYGRKFAVNEHVLIPRPETEELVEHVINKVGKEPVTIADIGTGSGIIATTLKLELPHTTVFASDISEKALEVAKGNAETLHADVNFIKGNFLQPFVEGDVPIDVLVSNPPYIAKSEEKLLSDTVKNFDPSLALFAEEEGLAAYRMIMEQARKIPNLKGIVFEIGHSQSKAVHQLIQSNFPESTIETIQDINGKDRIVSAQL